jgi:glycosyltransferase involved in cell wall biosynthesis
MQQVLLVTPRYRPFVGGVETHVAEVAPRIASRGIGVTILTTDPARTYPRTERQDGVTLLRVPAFPRDGDLYWAPEVYQAIREGPWQLVHCQGIHTFVPVLAMLAARRHGTPYVVTFHSGGHDSRVRNSLRRIQWLALAPLLRRADALVAVSEFEAALFHGVTGLAGRPIRVIPNGAALPELAEAPDVDPNLIVSVGRLERYKGHQRVIAAVPHLIARRPDVRLRIAGSGPYEPELRRLATRLGIADRVEIGGIPATERAAMASLLARAGAVILMSEYEAHPLAALEAAALGRPLIVADTTGLRELAARGVARSVPLNAEPDALAAVIDQELRSESRAAVALPSWDDCADLLVDLYRSILTPA